MWNKVMKPIAKFVADWPDAYKVLLEIADEFKPNAGHSLSDRIEVLEAGQQNLSLQVTNITRQIEVYLVGRQPVGESSSGD